MPLKLVSDNPNPTPWPWGNAIMSPAQHRAQAALLRQAGNEELAYQHDLLARMIEHRHKLGDR